MNKLYKYINLYKGLIFRKYLTKYVYLSIFISIPFLFTSPVLAGPESTTYELKEFGFGSGGTEGADSSNYSLYGVTGEVDLGNTTSSTYQLKAGLTETIQTFTPSAPALTNPSDFYNKLKIVIDDGGNPADTVFLIQVSTSSDFSSNVLYVQADHTLGASEVWQDYTLWSGATGFNILGLSPGTTYYARVSARQGNFTQSPFSDSASEETVNPTLTFDIDVSSIDEETDAPYSVSIGSLTAATVVTSPNKVWVDLSTNSANGGLVYVYGTNGGLTSSSIGSTITSSTANLTSVSEGYGAKSNSLSQADGGPFQAVSPYNGASENVGVLDSTKRIIFDSSGSPIISGRASFLLKAKASAVRRAAPDYTDTLTIIATASF